MRLGTLYGLDGARGRNESPESVRQRVEQAIRYQRFLLERAEGVEHSYELPSGLDHSGPDPRVKKWKRVG